MSEVTIGVCAGAGNGALPPSRAACQARIAELQDEIAAIRAQIASADLDRQARRGRIDARWFHRAKTALRHRRRELAELTAQMARLPAQTGRKDLFKDSLIEVLRADYEDDAWERALTRAKDLQRMWELG
jgi:chromosome segregation ATPase